MIPKGFVNAVKSDGTLVPYEIGKGYKLGVAVYYFDVSFPDAARSIVHMAWDAALTGTVTYQGSNLPAYKSESAPYTDSSGGVDVSLFDATAGNWITEDPTTAYVPVVTGVTVANQTLTIAGSNAGGTRFDVVNGYRRARIRVNATTGGFFRCHANAKSV
jgi:hypothetical protein